MSARFIGSVPDEVWRAVLAHYLAVADSFAVHMPDGDGPLSAGRGAFETLPGVMVGVWDGMRDAVEITGPISPEAVDLFVSAERSLELLDPGRKLWDYRLLAGGVAVLSIGDFTDLLIDEPDPSVLPRLGVPAERPDGR